MDSVKIQNGKSDLSMNDKAINHHEKFKLSCDDNYFKSGSQVRTCWDGSISPSFEEDPFVCIEGGLVPNVVVKFMYVTIDGFQTILLFYYKLLSTSLSYTL